MRKIRNLFILGLFSLLVIGCDNSEGVFLMTTPTPTSEALKDKTQGTPVPTASDSITISGSDISVSPQGTISDEPMISGSSDLSGTPVPVITDAPIVSGSAVISGGATVSGSATVSGGSIVTGGAALSSTPAVTQGSVITGFPTVTKNPVATGTPVVTKTPIVTITPAATKAPVVTNTPVATKTPVPTKTPTPTKRPTSTPTKKPTPTNSPTPTVYQHVYSSQLHNAGQTYLVKNKDIVNEHLKYVNQLRTSLGLKELTLDTTCSNIAAYRTAEMVSLDYFSHYHPPYDSNSSLPFDYSCMSDVVYFYQDSYRYLAENIAEFKVSGATVNDWVSLGNSIAKQLYDQFYGSEGHYQNMVNPNHTKIGLCIYVSDNHVLISQIFE